VGLAPGRRRRTPGLRREEVAQLANVGITWYTFLEQGRPIPVSAAALQRVAQALRLSPDETRHLFNLAERPVKTNTEAAPEPTPAVRQFIAGLGSTPAWVMNVQGDVLAWNPAACAVGADLASVPPEERNLVSLMFSAHELITRVIDWEEHAQRFVAELRLTYGEHPGDPRFTELIDRLLASSSPFLAWWQEHDVNRHSSWEIAIDHRVAGRLEFSAIALHPTASPSLGVVVFTPLPGTDTAERITALLRRSSTASA
jgi:transcriptional regulator with XRE-family HTH domain